MSAQNDSPIIVALDYEDAQKAEALVAQLSPELCRLKVGKHMFTRFGPDFVAKLVDSGFDVFLDLKFHDIPNTVADAVRAAIELGVWMLNVHASGGRAMMEAAANALAQTSSSQKPLLIGVTMLTSLENDDLNALGFSESTEQLVLRLAQLAKNSGLDGVVCSAQEAVMLRKACGDDFCLVTPGIRLPESSKGDQKRVMTPEAAVAAGADYLVIGRSITQSSDPEATLRRILGTLPA